MSSDIAIKVDGLSKCYQIYATPKDRLKQFVLPPIQRMVGVFPKPHCREFWALRDISFEVEKGETVGIIGRNGSGKSTLLQIICGTLNQTNGSVNTHGRIAALLELGSGFNPEFTGRENVLLNASVFGLTRSEIDARFEEIVAFADIGDFIEQPVKTYSSGMMVRLAFAVIAHVDADILIVDEALAVGDAFFTQRCMRFIRQFQANGGTLLFVSHDTAAVTNLCERVIYLESGVEKIVGNAKDVVAKYLEDTCAKESSSAPISIHSFDANRDEPKDSFIDAHSSHERMDYRLKFINASNLRNDIQVFNFNPGSSGFGTGGATIRSVRLLDENRNDILWLVGGEYVCLEISCHANQDIESPIIGFQIKDRLGQVVFSDNTFLSHQGTHNVVKDGQSITAEFEFWMPLIPTGEYTVSPAIANGTQEKHVQLHWQHDAVVLKVQSSSIVLGLVGLPMQKISLKVS